MSRYYLFVPGILQHPSGHDDWADFAVDWVYSLTPDRGGEYEYRSPALTRFVGQGARVAACAKILSRQAELGRELVAVGHSNGCAIILDVLRATNLKFEALHLIAAAAPAHCGTNGLNDAAERGRVKGVYLYGSYSDGALWWGGVSRKLFGWCGLGYGDLGRSGPCKMTDRLAAMTRPDWREGWGHSDWLSATHFEETMRLVTR